jgi:tripeptide aminopeptidase
MDLTAVLTNPAFRRAEAAISLGFDQFVQDIVTLTEIPAPPFQEGPRAAAFSAMLSQGGLAEVSLDGVGNVLGLRPGRGNGQLLCIAAHLDTVFPPGTDTRVRRDGNRLYAPGVGDDTRGLAVVLALARAMTQAGLETRHDILFVADVGEEGPGDLRGMRYLFQHGAYAGKIDAFISFDGMDMESLVTGGIGSHRYRITFSGPGGHSFIDFGIVNPSNAIGDFLAGLARVTVPREPRTTFSASMLGGGTSINAIPQKVWVDVDLRSADPAALATLDRQMRDLVDTAVTAENERGSTAKGAIVATLEQVGDRPAAPLRTSGPMIDEAVAALAAYGFQAKCEASSTDANIPLSLGIPAVMFGSGIAAGSAHTLEEWIDVEPESGKRALAASLMAVVAVAGIAE